MHCYEHGIPELCVSDLGSQLTSDINIISDYLNDFNTKKYFSEHNVTSVIPLLTLSDQNSVNEC